jgi:hypothetical protein
MDRPNQAKILFGRERSSPLALVLRSFENGSINEYKNENIKINK